MSMSMKKNRTPSSSLRSGDIQTLCMSDGYFKVPADQRRVNPDAYQPLLFSFGPYHAAMIPIDAADADVRDPSILTGPAGVDSSADSYSDARNELHCSSNESDHVKVLLAEALLGDGELRALVHSIQKHDAELRQLYIQMPPVKLGAMSASSLALRLVLDSITIVTAALHLSGTDQKPNLRASMPHHIVRLSLSDALLLENQVPVFVLFAVIEALRSTASTLTGSSANDHELNQQMLYQVVERHCAWASPFPALPSAVPFCVDPHSRSPLLPLIYNHLTEAAVQDAVDPQQQLESSSPSVNQSKSSVVRSSHAINSKNPALLPHTGISILQEQELDLSSSDSMNEVDCKLLIVEDPLLPSASHLVRCGVKLRACKYAGFQGIRLTRSRKAVPELSIPAIVVSENTVRALHNLLAYEATAQYLAEPFVVSFVSFMDRLINTEEDVQVLVNAGVIRNGLRSHQELVSMWSKLRISVSCRMSANDSAIIAELEAFAKQRWRRCRASLKKLWEKQPGILVSVVVGLIVLVLTLAQVA